jgi:hypothetical protein
VAFAVTGHAKPPAKRSDEERRHRAEADRDALLAKGEVEPVLLLPKHLGGTDDPRNLTWLPPACIRMKDAFDVMVHHTVEGGARVAYSAIPSYGDDDSMIPARLVLEAVWDGGQVKQTIVVSGCRKK